MVRIQNLEQQVSILSNENKEFKERIDSGQQSIDDKLFDEIQQKRLENLEAKEKKLLEELARLRENGKPLDKLQKEMQQKRIQKLEQKEESLKREI